MTDDERSDSEWLAWVTRELREQHDRDLMDVVRAQRRKRMRAEFNGIFDEEYAAAPHAEEFEICADMAREMIGVLFRKFDSLPGRLRDRGLSSHERIATMQRAREHLGELLTAIINIRSYQDWGRPEK